MDRDEHVPGRQLTAQDEQRYITLLASDLEWLEEHGLTGYSLEVTRVKFDNEVIQDILKHKKGGEAIKLAEMINPSLPQLTRGHSDETTIENYRSNMKKLIRCVKQGHLRGYAKDLIRMDQQVEAFILDYSSHDQSIFSSRNHPDRQSMQLSNIFRKSNVFSTYRSPSSHALYLKEYASYRWPGDWGLENDHDEQEESSSSGSESGSEDYMDEDEEAEANAADAAKRSRVRGSRGMSVV